MIHPFATISLLLVLSSTVILGESSSSIVVNPCSQKPESPILDSAMFLNQSCYFSVTNATESSSLEEWSLFRFELVFNMTNAREMCAAHGGTLPVINSDEENRFVAAYQAHEFTDEWGEKKVFRVALGMARNPTTGLYEWDDGTEVAYQPSHGWERKHWASRDCATLRRHSAEPIWLSFPCHGVGIGRLGVLCKRVVNPDCQYVLRSSANSTCVRDHLDEKTCYEMAEVEILAPPLKGGKECPSGGILRSCPCKEVGKAGDLQKDEPRIAIGCEIGASCPLVAADKGMASKGGNPGAILGGLMITTLTALSILVLGYQ